MKKFILLGVFLVVGFTAASAQTGFFAGVKLGGEFGFSKVADDMENVLKDENPGLTYNEKSKFAFTLGGYGGYGITDKLAVLAEMDLYFGQGIKIEATGNYDGEMTIKYSSMDLPILLRYAFGQSKTMFGLQVGPYFSFPLRAEIETAFGVSASFDLKGINLGALGGLFLSYPAGSGRIVGDLRFLFDFTPLKDAADLEVLKRRGVVLTIGYEFFW